MNERIAKVKTEETGWKLIAELREVCPHDLFCLVKYAPGEGCEVVPAVAIHPHDRKAAKAHVIKFAKALSATA